MRGSAAWRASGAALRRSGRWVGALCDRRKVAAEFRRGAGHGVPSPFVGRDGVGGSGTSEGGSPPTPNPSPQFGCAPSARRGGESDRRKWSAQMGGIGRRKLRG